MNIVICNRQRTKKINLRLYRQIVAALFAELEISEAELGIQLVGAKEMARVNRQFLQHEGSTDVITFDHGPIGPEIRSSKAESRKKSEARKPNQPMELPESPRPTLHGELYICVDDAVAQAGQFQTTWQAEIVRYAVHGILHLLGHDDLKPDLRRKMKREENRLVRRLANRFSLAQLSRPANIGA
jgi:rRNA maturation RNase YbeY